MLKVETLSQLPKSAKIGTRIRCGRFLFEKSANGKWGIVKDKYFLSVVNRFYHKDNLNMRQTAEKLSALVGMKLSHSVVQSALVELGSWRSHYESGARQRKVFNANLESILKLYKSGEPWQYIADRFGITATFVDTELRSLGYKTLESKRLANANRKSWRQENGVKHGLFIQSVEKMLSLDISKMSMDKYRRTIIRFTNCVLNQFGHIVDPKGLRSKDYHVDHKLSVFDGYFDRLSPDGESRVAKVEKIPLRLMCHPANFEILDAKANMSIKRNRSSVTVAQLKREIKKFNQEYGDPFKV